MIKDGKSQNAANRPSWKHSLALLDLEGGMVDDGENLTEWYLQHSNSSSGVERLLGDSADEQKKKTGIARHHEKFCCSQALGCEEA